MWSEHNNNKYKTSKWYWSESHGSKAVWHMLWKAQMLGNYACKKGISLLACLSFSPFTWKALLFFSYCLPPNSTPWLAPTLKHFLGDALDSLFVKDKLYNINNLLCSSKSMLQIERGSNWQILVRISAIGLQGKFGLHKSKGNSGPATN